MPEGDSVLTAANNLHRHLAGRVLSRGDLLWPTAPATGISGARVLEVDAYAKHLLIRLDTGITVRTHLRMDGYWRFVASLDPRAQRNHSSLRMVLANEQWTALGYFLGMLDIVKTQAEPALLAHMGPDVLSDFSVPTPFLSRTVTEPGLRLAPRNASGQLGVVAPASFTPSEEAIAAGALIREASDGRTISDSGWRLGIARFAQQPPERPIGETLLDQTVVSGIGTIHMAEALFALETSPWRAIAECDVPRILAFARMNLVRASLDYPRGRTIHVHERHDKPCRRCNTIIKVEKVGPPLKLRPAFFCPRCQAT